MVNSEGNAKPLGELIVRSRLSEYVSALQGRTGEVIKQKDIAAQTGISEQTISRWMNPKPLTQLNVGTLEALMKYFNCRFEDIVHIEYIDQDQSST